MFTGIITDLGEITAIEGDSDRRLTVRTRFDLADVPLGASICHNGVCLTVTSKGDHRFTVDASGETLRVTTLGGWQVGTPVNLERSLKIGDELGGHIVFGHVDGVGTIRAFDPVGDSRRLEITLPDALRPLVAVKGSIAVDGISLTVNEVSDDSFVVNIIPHTWQHTNLHAAKAGDRVNLEADMLERYVARQTAFLSKVRA
ncbi:MAG: riboflavin synthase [Geminicoccaceae bacterium]